jgi:hypothetical protein
MTGHAPAEKKGAIMNKENHKTNDATKFEETIALLEQAVKRMGPVPRLSTQARARGLKMRRGGHAVVPTIAAIATKYGIEAPNVRGDAMNVLLAELQSHAALVMAVIEIHALITDSEIGVGRSLWSSTTTLYTMLRRAARSNPSIAAELKPVEEWFRYRKPAVTKPKPDAPTSDASKATE